MNFFSNMNIADLLTLLTALGAVLTFWFKFGGTISKLKTVTDQQTSEIFQLKQDLNIYKKFNEDKIERLAGKIDAIGDNIGSKLSLIDKDLGETSMFLKTNLNFLSSISKENKERIDYHEKRFTDVDKAINEIYRTNTK